jgi:glutaredoxin
VAANAAVVLLGTSGCHLCDHARDLLAECRPAVRVTSVDIASDDALIERYGERIPVIRAPGQTELSWPFSAAELSQWLRPLYCS